MHINVNWRNFWPLVNLWPSLSWRGGERRSWRSWARLDIQTLHLPPVSPQTVYSTNKSPISLFDSPMLLCLYFWSYTLQGEGGYQLLVIFFSSRKFKSYNIQSLWSTCRLSRDTQRTQKITADTTRRRHQSQQRSVDPYFWPQWNELSSQPCPRSKQRDMYISVYIQRLNFCVQRPIDSTWGRNFQPAAFRVGPYTRDNFLLTNVRCNSVKFPCAEAGTVGHSMRSRRKVCLGGTAPPWTHSNVLQLTLLKWFHVAVCSTCIFSLLFASDQSRYRTPPLVMPSSTNGSETFLKGQSTSVTTDNVLILGASLIWRWPVQFRTLAGRMCIDCNVLVLLHR